jgi:hypothetical protein
MDTPKMITIQEARRSQSGKTLGIRDQDGTWYQTKCWDLELATGHTIYAMTSISEFQGKQMHWINSYEYPAGATPPVQAPARKTVTFSNIDAAWSAYLVIYANYMDWRDKGHTPQAAANETAQNQGFSDDIPF